MIAIYVSYIQFEVKLRSVLGSSYGHVMNAKEVEGEIGAH